jgi:hypothetical protein
MAASLQRIIIEFKAGELAARVLYRSKGESNPGTVRRRREVTDRCREGLEWALAALEGGDVTMCGTSGFTQREDVILLTTSPDAQKLVKGA